MKASSIGVPFPLNSVGLLPLEYLNSSDARKSALLYSNARQVYKQFLQKSGKPIYIAMHFNCFRSKESKRVVLCSIRTSG